MIELKTITKITLLIAVTGFFVLILGLASLTGGQSYANSFIITGLAILLIDVFVPAVYELFFN